MARKLPRHKRRARRSVHGGPSVHPYTLSVTLSELGHKDEHFDNLEDALAEMRARYPHAQVGNWSRPKQFTDYGETLSWTMAKWGETYKPRPGVRSRVPGARANYDGKIVKYFTAEHPADYSDIRRKFGWE